MVTCTISCTCDHQSYECDVSHRTCSSSFKQNRNAMLKPASLDYQMMKSGVVDRGFLPKLVLGFKFSQKLSDGYMSLLKDI